MKIIPKKSLGQNFLIDIDVIEKICNSGNINENNNVLEIGPGTGNLTEFILQKKPKKFHVIEKDERLINNLKNRLKNKSVVIVSHRVSCIKHSDKIIVLENGKIIQQGTHKNLINMDGYYKELYNKQNSEIT